MKTKEGRYVVHFRTIKNGAYKWMNGKKRGYWQLLFVPEGAKTEDLRSKGVRLIDRSPQGIFGVTKNSSYYLDEFAGELKRRAEKMNNDRNQIAIRLRAVANAMANVG